LADFGEHVERLKAFYGPLPLPPADPFQYFVWEVLGARTTPGRRDAALSALRRVPALTPDSLRKLGRGRLEAILRQCGLFLDERLAALDAGVTVFRRPHFLERLQGSFLEAWKAARELPHLDHAGTLRLLMFTGGSRLVPVDGGIARVTLRLGLATQLRPRPWSIRDVRQALNVVLPSNLVERQQAVIYLRHHAERTCVEAAPHCRICPLHSACPEGLRLYDT
jgi:endonuclease III